MFKYFFSILFFAYIAVEDDANLYIELLRKEPKHEVYSLFDPEIVILYSNYLFSSYFNYI